MAISQINTNSIASGAVSAADLADGSVTAAKLAAGVGGKVLQVVSFANSTEQNTTSNSVTPTLYSQAITPSSSSSKILVTFACPIRKNNSVSADGIAVFLYRNGVQTANLNWWFLYSTSGGFFQFSHTYLDSPATTSSVTYDIRVRNYASGNSFIINDNAAVGTLTLMEIAA